MKNASIASVRHLSHRYSASWAVKNISFDINQHGILGLLGSNGAGKSTTMNIMCGVINQTEGEVFIDGMDIRNNPVEAKRRIGFLPQKAPLHLELTVDEYLIHCAYMRSIPQRQIKQAVDIAKEKCGISHFSKRVLSNLSGGYQQRVGIAQAIIHNPALVVLDEPTNGLDPNQILEVRKLIREIAEDRAVILSTHILSEVQATCKDIIMIEQGEIVFFDSMAAFNNYIEPNTMMVTMDELPALEELQLLSGIEKVDLLSETQVRLHFAIVPDITKSVISTCAQKGWPLTEIYLEKSSLDGIFARLSNKKPTV